MQPVETIKRKKNNKEFDIEDVVQFIELPENVKFKIFYYCGINSIQQLFSVSKYFNNIVHNEILWRKLYLNKYSNFVKIVDNSLSWFVLLKQELNIYQNVLQRIEKQKEKGFYKITIIGDKYSGKSSLAARLANLQFVGDYIETDVEDIYESLSNGSSIKTTYCTLSGAIQLKPVDLTLIEYTFCWSGVDVFVVCFSVADSQSFTNLIDCWLPLVQRTYLRSVPIVLVGTKIDLGISISLRKKAKKVAKNVQTIYVECCLSDDTSIVKIRELLTEICQTKKVPQIPKIKEHQEEFDDLSSSDEAEYILDSWDEFIKVCDNNNGDYLELDENGW